MKSKTIISFLLIASILLAIPTIAYGGCTWSDKRTISLAEDGGWKRKTTSNDMAKDKKETTSNLFYVTSVKLTMVNNPKFRMVDSYNSVVSDEIKTGNAGNTKHGNNYGSKGQTYYASVKPNPLQTGTDSYTFTFSAE